MNTDFFDQQIKTEIITAKFSNINNHTSHFFVKRDDQIDVGISGNKWRKLKHNFTTLQPNSYSGIASFGGAYSNHIAALAAAGHRANVATLGFIRTHAIDENNPTLSFAQQMGMKLVPLTRQDYRLRKDPQFVAQLQQQYPQYYFVPEGGSNQQAQIGLTELAREIEEQGDFDFISCAIGSGGTIRGLMRAMPNHRFVGVPVVNDVELLEDLQQEFGERLTLKNNFLFGGYGKTDEQLNTFCLDFFTQTNIPIEPIYSGKLFFAWCHDSELQTISATYNTLLVHTGGLQGLKGLSCRHPSLLSLLQQLIPDSVVL